MATVAQSVPEPQRQSAWLWEFFREELRPYPGRVGLVARMMIAATIAMLISMTFRIPEGAYGGVFALTLSRESPRATVADVRTLTIAFVIAAAYEVIGAMFFVDDPVLRLVWVIATFFLMFYCLSALTNYVAAIRFGYLVIITTPLWDQHVSAETRVEGTLWAVLTITVASIITALVELAYAEFNRGGDLIRPLSGRLARIEELLFCYAEGRPVNETIEQDITRLAVVGMSQLRRTLYRSVYSSQYREQMGAVLSLVGRLLDLAANLMNREINVSDADRERMRRLAERLARIRIDLERGAIAPGNDLHAESDGPAGVPLLQEMETTVSLIPKIFVGSQSLIAYAPLESVDSAPAKLFRADALSNLEHVKFGLKGALAASLCYAIYNLVDWAGISTAVTTCFLTAQSTIGSSRQKQVLRIAGAIIGGLVLGIGAQVFILPHLDSIAEFTVLFLGVTFIACWFATCSARLSYFGVQIAVAFYLINLQEFKVQTSLGVARDRVAGILLGLFMMWLVFDQLWGAPAAVEMKRAFSSNLRLLAQYTREPLSQDLRTAIDRGFALREMLSTAFDKVRALADGVLLEFGPSRGQDLALRNRIRQWQPKLRLIFIARTVLWKYRMQLPGFELPETVRIHQREYDEHSAQALEEMADEIDGRSAGVKATASDSSELQRVLQACRTEGPEQLSAGRIESFAALLREIDELTASLAQEIAMEASAGLVR